MAAFIQKLFRSRKATPAPAPKKTAPKPAEASQADARNERQLLREAQESQLRSNPDQSVVASLAIDGATAGIRLKAAAGLKQEALLQQVLKQARSGERVVDQAVRHILQPL